MGVFCDTVEGVPRGNQQLLGCCDDHLRKDLTPAAGGTLTANTEKEVLTEMEALAVRRENILVARVTLHNMSQDRDETIWPFGARFKVQAGTCKYVPKCSPTTFRADVDFTETILRDVLGRGMAAGSPW